MIPISVFQMLRGKPVTVFGDADQTRGFVIVADVVQADLSVAVARNVSGAFNIGSGSRISINRLITLIHAASGIEPTILHGPSRPRDVLDRLADISAATTALRFAPAVTIEDGLAE